MNGTIANIPQAVNGQLPTAPMIPRSHGILPESQCSINGFVKIGRHETRDHQVTGRGQTPEEAAANFFGCVEVLEAGYAARAARAAAPPPLASRTQRLGLLLACGMEKAVGNTPRIERLLKAAALVLAGCVSQESDGTYAVRSQTDPETTVYHVAGRACSCQDAAHHADDSTFWCKHTLGALLTIKLALQGQEHAAACQGR